MTTDDDVLAAATATLRGDILRPGHPEYDEARRLWNADIDRRPALIARCASTEDVQAAVTTAVRAGLEIAVRGGGHSLAGWSVCDDGLMINLGRMNRVSVDPETKRAHVQGGALLGDLDQAAQAHGLAVPLGIVSHTGVGGLTLGGGLGYLGRLHGLALDNLVSAEIVLADGRILRTDDCHEPDLFWAIRGGGGNFGIVTDFEFQLHDVGPMVQVGLFFWGLERGREALQFMRELIADLPLTLNATLIVGLTAPPAPFVPPEHQFETGYALLLCGFGDPAEHAQAVEQIRSTLPPLFDLVTPMPYVGLQAFIDEGNAPGSYGYDKGAYLPDLTDDVISVLTSYVPRKTSPQSVIGFYRLDGAYSEVADDATAFSGPRRPCYYANLIGICPAPEMLKAERAWIRALHEDLQPYAIGTGSYVNAVPATDAAGVRDAYGAKFARLQEIKATYDPANVFHRNANIPPATSA